MKIYHTSPTAIKAINDSGILGSCLCFSDNVYVMTGSIDYVTYSIDVDEENVWEGCEVMFSRNDEVESVLQAVAKDFAAIVGCDEDTAADYLCDQIDMPFNPDFPEACFELQRFQGLIAQRCGFDAFKTRDEQGTLYIVPMADKFSELQIEGN